LPSGIHLALNEDLKYLRHPLLRSFRRRKIAKEDKGAVASNKTSH